MTAPANRKEPLKCPECGARLDYSRDPYGRVYQCTNMTCLSTFDENDDLGDDPVRGMAVLVGEPVEIIREYEHCGRALDANDRSCALPKGHRGGNCAPASDL